MGYTHEPYDVIVVGQAMPAVKQHWQQREWEQKQPYFQ